MTMRGFETVGIKAVIDGLPQYLAGARAITQANVGISGSLSGIGSVTTGFKLLAAAAAGVTAVIGGAAISAGVKYESTLAKIDALTNTSTEDTQKLGKGILQLSKVVPKSPDELGAAAYFALSSGITDVDEALKLVTAASKASAAGLGSTADIVDIVTAAVNAYGPANLDAARAVDILVAAVREGKGEPAQMAAALGSLLPLAAQLKIPFEEVAGIFASLTNALGGSGAAEMAGTQLRGILNQIISPSKEAKNALAEAEAGVKTLSQEELALAEASRQVVQSSDSLASAQRGVRNALEGVVSAQRGVRDAQEGVASAQRASRSATEALRNAYADLTAAQRNQQQASLDGRRETLSVLEAEQGLRELRTQAGSHAQELAQAELALAQARENASSRDKKTALEQKQAALAVSQAEQRLNQVRAQGPRYALDLRNAELRIEEARARVGTAQKEREKQIAQAQKEVQKATQDVTDAHRNELRARENLGDANRGLERSYEGVTDAQRNVARASSDLALAREKELLAQIHTRDAYADLRKEIAEKGFPATMQRLNELFKDNQEGLAKLFPDVRAFTGFLASMRGEGNATVGTVDNIRKSLGLTDEVFKRMSETTATQATILKNQLNVALISLGSTVLPLVNAGLLKLNGYFAQAADFFTKGFNGTKLGGDFKAVEQAAFNAGEKARELTQWIKDNQENIKSVFSFVGETFLQDAKATISWFIENKEAMAIAFGVIGTFFALSNPAWAGILAGGAILVGVQLLKSNLEELSDPLIKARIRVDEFLLRLLNALEKTREFALSVGTLGLSNIGPIRDLLDKRPGSKAINEAQADLAEDIRKANKELAERNRLRGAEAEIQVRINALLEEARQKGMTFDDALQLEVEAMIRLGGATDGWARKLVEAAATVKGVDPSRIEYLRMELDDAAANAGKLGAATEAVKAPDVGDAGKAALDEATRAALDEAAATEAVDPPDVGDAGKRAIDAATGAALAEKGALAAIRPPNVGDSGWSAIARAAREAATLATNLGTAAANAARIGGGIGSLAGGGATRRAEGGIVTRPDLSLIGEAGPEAVLPLTKPARSREILRSLPQDVFRSIIPVQAFGGGGISGMLGAALGKQELFPLGHYLNPGPDEGRFETWMESFFIGKHAGRTTTGAGESSGGFGAPASKQVYATLPPSMVRAMTPANNAGVTFESMFGGDINVGATSREVEELTVQTVRGIFARARTQTAIGGGLITSGIG